MPPTEPVRTSGSPVWIDLTASDPQTSARFFSELLGWRMADDQTDGYRLALLDDEPVGGVARAMNSSREPVTLPRDHVTVYLATDDVDAALVRVTDAGGTVQLPAMDVPGAGRLAICGDTAGNAFGLWQAAGLPGFAKVNAPGWPTFFELRCLDPKAEAEFFSAVFGLDFGEMVVGGQQWRLNPAFGIVQSDEVGWLVNFFVQDVRAAVAQAEKAGAELLAGPHEFEYGASSTLRSPQGARFGLFQPRVGP